MSRIKLQLLTFVVHIYYTALFQYFNESLNSSNLWKSNNKSIRCSAFMFFKTIQKNFILFIEHIFAIQSTINDFYQQFPHALRFLTLKPLIRKTRSFNLQSIHFTHFTNDNTDEIKFLKSNSLNLFCTTLFFPY